MNETENPTAKFLITGKYLAGAEHEYRVAVSKAYLECPNTPAGKEPAHDYRKAFADKAAAGLRSARDRALVEHEAARFELALRIAIAGNQS